MSNMRTIRVTGKGQIKGKTGHDQNRYVAGGYLSGV